MAKRRKYVIRNDDEGWTYVGIDDYSKEIPLLSSYARKIQPGANAIDIVMKNWVNGKESPPHLLVGTITLDEPREAEWTEGGKPIMDFPTIMNLLKNPPPDDFDYGN